MTRIIILCHRFEKKADAKFKGVANNQLQFKNDIKHVTFESKHHVLTASLVA